MSDAWIISNHRFKEHASFEDAEAELYRLQRKHPKENFRIYRIKNRLTRGDMFQRLVAAAKRFLEVSPVPPAGTASQDFRQRVDQVTAADDLRSLIDEIENRTTGKALKEAAQ